MQNVLRGLTGERRRAYRHHVDIALRYRARDSSTEHSSRSENISETGIFFTIKQTINIGTTLDVMLDMPNAVSGDLSSVWYTGHVVRVASTGSTCGVGVQLDCFEIVDGKSFPQGSVLPVAS